MARKLRKDEPNKAPPKSGADDLSTIHPDRSISIGGRDVTVREYGFIEGLGVRGFMKPFTEDLDRMFVTKETLVDEILDVLGDHAKLVERAMAQSIAEPGTEATAEDMAWVRSLNDADGDVLIHTWWGVNGLFFVRSVVRRAAERARRATLERAIEEASKKDLVGAMSMPPSPTRDSETHSD